MTRGLVKPPLLDLGPAARPEVVARAGLHAALAQQLRWIGGRGPLPYRAMIRSIPSIEIAGPLPYCRKLRRRERRVGPRSSSPSNLHAHGRCLRKPTTRWEDRARLPGWQTRLSM